MKPFNLESWVRLIAETQPEEISCSECLDQIPGYVEAEQAGGKPSELMTRVAQHLVQCQVCREEYEVLNELVALENKGRAPSIDDLKASLES